jgi:hypothetical protein
MMNDALKNYLSQNSERPITESALRRILKEKFSEVAMTPK